jgi:sulfate adenylyltransferase subunit 2
MEEYKLSHLKELEAESIHIIREVAAEFENPVMLYSIGKDLRNGSPCRKSLLSG